MSLIIEKHFAVLEYFAASFQVLEQLWNCSLLNYWLQWTFKSQN